LVFAFYPVSLADRHGGIWNDVLPLLKALLPLLNG
jgi:hypothetical protein